MAKSAVAMNGAKSMDYPDLHPLWAQVQNKAENLTSSIRTADAVNWFPALIGSTSNKFHKFFKGISKKEPCSRYFPCQKSRWVHIWVLKFLGWHMDLLCINLRALIQPKKKKNQKRKKKPKRQKKTPPKNTQRQPALNAILMHIPAMILSNFAYKQTISQCREYWWSLNRYVGRKQHRKSCHSIELPFHFILSTPNPRLI